MLEVMCLECFNQSEHNSGLFIYYCHLGTWRTVQFLLKISSNISEVGNEILWFYLLTRREKFREIEA